jgi:hypothetical protein
MAVKTLPGSPFEVIEAEFLFHLLMYLLNILSIPAEDMPAGQARLPNPIMCS